MENSNQGTSTGNSIIFFLIVVAIFVAMYFLLFKKKKESSFKIDYRDPKKEMRTLMGMGNYGSVLGCEGGKCY